MFGKSEKNPILSISDSGKSPNSATSAKKSIAYRLSEYTQIGMILNSFAPVSSNNSLFAVCKTFSFSSLCPPGILFPRVYKKSTCRGILILSRQQKLMMNQFNLYYKTSLRLYHTILIPSFYLFKTIFSIFLLYQFRKITQHLHCLHGCQIVDI